MAEKTTNNRLYVIRSVCNEVTELGWPDLWDIFSIVVPPVLLTPSVEFGSSWGEVPSKSFASSNEDPEKECNSDVTSHISTNLGSSNKHSNENPKGEDPGEWDNPGDGSVVEFLHDSIFGGLDVGKEPEGAESTEGRSKGPLHNAESVPLSLGEAPCADAAGTDSARSPGLDDDHGEHAHEPPEKAEPDGLQLVFLVEVGGVEDGHVSNLCVVSSVAHILIIKL